MEFFPLQKDLFSFMWAQKIPFNKRIMTNVTWIVQYSIYFWAAPDGLTNTNPQESAGLQLQMDLPE